MNGSALTRVVRRETHSPRTVAMCVAVALVLIGLAYVVVEMILHLAGQHPLIFSPGAWIAWTVALPSGPDTGLVIAGGVAVGLVGLVFVVLAITPGRLPKHEMTWGPRAVVIDNGVLAASLADRVSIETGIPRDRVRVGVAHRTVDVVVRPGPGVPLTLDDVRAAAQTELDSYRLARRVAVRCRIERPTEGRPGE